MALQAFKRLLRQWLFKPSAAAQRQPPGLAPNMDHKAKSNAAMTVHIRQILKTKSRASVSRLQLISLAKIREKFPDSPDVSEEKIRDTLKSVIMQRLGPEDAFTDMGKDAFIIVFHSLERRDAELQCVLIVQEVLRSLFDDRRLDDKVDIRTVTIGLDGSVNAEQVDLLEVIDNLLCEGAGGGSTDIPARAASPVVAQAAAERAAEIAEDARIAAAISPDLHFLYCPMWDVARKVIYTYSCIVTDGANAGYGVLGRDPDPYLIPALDFFVFRAAQDRLARLQAQKKRLLITFPVHVNTLCDAKTWTTYRALCDRLAEKFSHNDIVFEIAGAENAEPGMLVFGMRKIQEYAHHMVVRMPPEPPRISFPGDCRPRYLFTDFSSFPGSEKRKMRMMDAYVNAAHEMKTEAMITNLGALREVVAAVGSGFSCIGGDAVHPKVENPDYIFRFDTKNLLDRLGGVAPREVKGVAQG